VRFLRGGQEILLAALGDSEGELRVHQVPPVTCVAPCALAVKDKVWATRQADHVI
jgi:hypothetical protein